MGLGAVLLQPQKFRRAAGRTGKDNAFVDDAIALVTRLVIDQQQDGPVLAVFQGAVDAEGQRLLTHMQSGINTAQRRLRNWIEPVLTALDGFAQSAGGDIGMEHVAEQVEALLTHLAGFSEDLSLDFLRRHIGAFLEIVEQDLKLTPDFLEGELWHIVDDIISRLDQAESADATERANYREVAALLRRIKRYLNGKQLLPRWTAEGVAQGLMSLLQRSGITELAGKVSCVGQAVGAGLHAGAAATAVMGSAVEAQSVGAAAANNQGSEQYCWYATWLLGFWPWDKVTVNADRTQLKNNDEVLYSGTDIEWHQAPLFSGSGGEHYTFGEKLTPQVMENISLYSAVAAEYLDAILHLTSLEREDYASNSLNAVLGTGYGTYKLLAKKAFHYGLEWPLRWPVPSLLASIEGAHTDASATNRFIQWLLVCLLPDVTEMALYRQWIAMARNFLLSLLTLVNYEGPEYADAFSGTDNRPLNRKQVFGVANGFVELFVWILVVSLSRDEYGHPLEDGGNPKQWGYLFGAGPAMGLAGAIVGTIVAECISWAEDWGALGHSLWKGLIYGFCRYPFYLYLHHDGNTDNGTYNPGGNAFNGYPDQATSPYRLPYPRGTTEMCVQGNQGIWSHNSFTDQIYAYDFGMDQDERIVACRPGTVVDYFDWYPNDTQPETAAENQAAAAAAAAAVLQTGQTTSPSWNFIIIRHDRDDAGNLVGPDADHDIGPGGNPVTTYAIYGHGRTGSVRAAFAAQGITANTIININRPVARGDHIMDAGDTGISAYNHLHVYVKSGPSNATGPPVASWNLDPGSIPFVFREVTHLIGTDGVPKAFNSYESENDQ